MYLRDDCQTICPWCGRAAGPIGLYCTIMSVLYNNGPCIIIAILYNCTLYHDVTANGHCVIAVQYC